MDSIRYGEKADSFYRTLGIYFILFLAAWSFREIVLPPYLSGLPETATALIKAVLKIMVWIVPVWLLIRFRLKSDPADFLKLNTNLRSGLLWGLGLSALRGLWFSIQAYVLNGSGFHFDVSFDRFLNIFLLVGLTEEIVFRGLLENRFALVCHHPSLVPQLLFDHHVKKLKDAPPSLSFFMFPPPDNRRRSIS
ncbi:hypothetical protein SAMN04488127_1733 [Bhargavaea ginsengi]|uniref:Uncharacterized protein n=1 Tax=Bhargavaea ginsengi TaxID=426757 RepID=A0A1H6YZQ7_9BACL|nr:hypothetical protein [Bhargavaea ginsengi]SEJ42892.1 hypothetical protein SAMN04488127_1733 [Bhargavaea ginsengi]